MKRGSDAELDDRIHKFLGRKFSEFPELDAGAQPPKKQRLTARYLTKARIFIS